MTATRTTQYWPMYLALFAAIALIGAGSDRANAFDLFGSSDDSSAKMDEGPSSESLWKEIEKPIFIKPKGVPDSFADLAEKVSPAVVNIRVSVSKPFNSMIPPQFRDFHNFPFAFPDRDMDFRSWGEGSGFVISSNGYVVTNAHVIDGADEIEVILLDGKKFRAEIIGVDKKTDIALIKVESDEPLATIPLGDSDLVRPGQWVVAIGNAMSLEHTVTAGIVSAKHRYLARGNYDDFIQTDAAINPGNSGGPLINLAGEVIGINSAINPRANTIGFAVPINMVKQILPQLRAKGHVTRSWLGVEIHELTEPLKEELGTNGGALVNRVLSATPAMKAGIEDGDVIVRFDGNPVANHRQLPNIVARTPVDRKVEVEVLRDGVKKIITVTLAAMEEPEQVLGRWRHSEKSEPEPATTLDTFGLDAQDLTPDLAEQLGLEDDHGVIVTRVVSGSLADDAGLLRGDVIIEIAGAAVGSTADLDILLESTEKGAILLVRRDRTTLFIPLKPQG
ncbi:MAG: Do family serine endopeptidase [Myxococcales bacterium]|nr:Do family serine endopeptidase [Myxococcales bacterium]